MDLIIILVATSSEDEAMGLSRILIELQLVACASILPKVKSIFQWEGKISEEEEYLMILKTKKSLFKAVEDIVLAKHSYEVPEIIALPILEGSHSYLTWVHDVTRNPGFAN